MPNRPWHLPIDDWPPELLIELEMEKLDHRLGVCHWCKGTGRRPDAPDEINLI